LEPHPGALRCGKDRRALRYHTDRRIPRQFVFGDPLPIGLAIAITLDDDPSPTVMPTVTAIGLPIDQHHADDRRTDRRRSDLAPRAQLLFDEATLVTDRQTDR
jgi:hypothetical protein